MSSFISTHKQRGPKAQASCRPALQHGPIPSFPAPQELYTIKYLTSAGDVTREHALLFMQTPFSYRFFFFRSATRQEGRFIGQACGVQAVAGRYPLNSV